MKRELPQHIGAVLIAAMRFTIVVAASMLPRDIIFQSQQLLALRQHGD